LRFKSFSSENQKDQTKTFLSFIDKSNYLNDLETAKKEKRNAVALY